VILVNVTFRFILEPLHVLSTWLIDAILEYLRVSVCWVIGEG